jgi:hypothetical protein
VLQAPAKRQILGAGKICLFANQFNKKLQNFQGTRDKNLLYF